MQGQTEAARSKGGGSLRSLRSKILRPMRCNIAVNRDAQSVPLDRLSVNLQSTIRDAAYTQDNHIMHLNRPTPS
jgi:hypothetical protein